jgi:hypothetical protein
VAAHWLEMNERRDGIGFVGPCAWDEHQTDVCVYPCFRIVGARLLPHFFEIICASWRQISPCLWVGNCVTRTDGKSCYEQRLPHLPPMHLRALIVKDPGLVVPIESGAANPVRGGIFVVVGRSSVSPFCFFGGAADKRFLTLRSFSTRRRKNKKEGCLGRCSSKYTTPNGVLQEVWFQPKTQANIFSHFPCDLCAANGQ